MLYLWWRMDEEGRQRVWSLYGWFCGLMVCGSCFGAVSWAALIMQVQNVLNANDAFLRRRDFVQQWSLAAISFSWNAVFRVMYAIEFMCLSAARLTVLDRFSDFAAGQDEVTRKLWAARGRIMMAVVVLGNAVGLAANVAAAVYAQRAADGYNTASALFAANSTQVANVWQYVSLSQTEAQRASSMATVQYFCEVAVLLLIVAAFVVAGVACTRYIRTRLLAVDAASVPAVMGNYVHFVGGELRRRVVVTTVVVFVAFVVRSLQSTMFAVANQLQDVASCPGVTGFCDPSCNVFTHMYGWSARTPEFRVMIVLISSPLTLLVALWGMTSRQTLHAMNSKKQEVLMIQRNP
jgi:hypothetical protein